MNSEQNSISIIIPSIYPKKWPRIIDNYQSTTVEVEIIFVGPSKCNSLLPKNVKFIKTNFKVIQCLEMGLKFSSNYYKLQSADDIVIRGSSDPLGDIVRAANSFPEHLVCLKIAMNGRLLSRNAINLISGHPKTMIPVAGILSKKMIVKVGGYNKNYIASFADVDLYLRLKNVGYRYKWLNIYMDEDRTPDDNLSLLSFRYLGHDIKYLKYNWVEYNTQTKSYFLRNKSKENFEPFNQKTLLNEEQGAGKAKIFKSKYFILFMKNRFFRYVILVVYKFYRKFILRAKFY